PRTPTPPLFPYTTLFRSQDFRRFQLAAEDRLGIVLDEKCGRLEDQGVVGVPLLVLVHVDLDAVESQALEDRQGCVLDGDAPPDRSEEHTSELQSLAYLVC